MNLKQTTLELLGKPDTDTLQQIAVGAGVNFYWLRKFTRGEIPNPSVDRVQKLYDFLIKEKVLNA